VKKGQLQSCSSWEFEADVAFAAERGDREREKRDKHRRYKGLQRDRSGEIENEKER